MQKICYGILLVLIISLLFLPHFLSSKLGTKILVFSVEKNTTKKIQVEKLHLSWLGEQKISQLEISDHNQPWFSSSQITLDSSLISLILFRKINKLEIIDPKLVWKEKLHTPSAFFKSPIKSKHSYLDLFNTQTLLVINGSFEGILLNYPPLQFDHINLTWNSNQDLGNLFVQADIPQTQGSANIEATCSLKTQSFFNPLTLIANCINLPTKFLTFFVPDSSLESVIGNVFNLKLDTKSSLEKQLYTFYLSSPLVKMQGTADWDKKEEKISAHSIPLSFTLTQDNYAFLGSFIKLPSLTVVEPSVFQGTINQLSFYTKSKGFFPMPYRASLSFNTTMKNENLILAHQDESSSISLQIKANVSEESISSQIQGTISAKKQGSFFSDISWIKQTEALQAEIRTLEVPTYLFEGLFPEISLQKLCGPSMDLTLHTKLLAKSGPLSLEILSPYSSFFLEGLLQKEAITLNKPFYCQLNKEAGSYVLKELFPSLQPKNPISIKIASGETLSFSLNSMQRIFPTMVIPTLEIEMGKMLCHNQNFANSLFNLLKINQFNASLTFNLWIAPITLHIDKGLITVERVELLLADLYEIAVWGKVKDHSLNMKIGLPSSTLAKAFQIQNLPDDYVLPLTLEGSLENPKINLKKAAAKIAALFICQQENKNPLNIFFPSCKPLQKMLVPPAKHPFPWEQTTALVKDKNRKRFAQDDKPLKQLLKVIR